jgi:hypothetical protein
MKAIKAYCFDNCQAGSGRDEVLNCKGDEPWKDVLQPCPVFPFRLGKNPNISMETREKARQRELRKVADGSNSLLKLPALVGSSSLKSSETGKAIVHSGSH